MKFFVLVRTNNGKKEKRVIEAASRFAVYDIIEKEKASVITLSEKSGFTMPAWLNISFGTGVSPDELVMVIKNISSMLDAGLTLSRALSIAVRQTRNKRFSRILSSVTESVKRGSTFHEALSEHKKLFSQLFISMTHAGEESGTLASSLRIVGTQMEQSRTLTKKVRGAMIYPIIIIIAMVIISILMLLFVVPTLTATFVQLGISLPLSTRIIVGTSSFLVHHTILVLLGIVAFVVGMISFAHSHFGGKLLFSIVLHTPVIGGLVQETYAARTARTLSSLLASGVDMLGAISITREVVGTEAFASILAEAEIRVRKGEQLSATFMDHLNRYPIMFSDMIAVGEETGKLAPMLEQVADFYEQDVQQRTKDLSTIIEPVLMIVIGTGVGIFAISIIAPIYSLSAKM